MSEFYIMHCELTCMVSSLSVETGSSHSCHNEAAMTLSSNNGYISSIITEQVNLGTALCPWRIVLEPGQRINLTLYDYGIPTAEELDKIGDLKDPSVCYQYGLVTERRYYYIIFYRKLVTVFDMDILR